MIIITVGGGGSLGNGTGKVLDDGRFDENAEHQEFREGSVHNAPHVGDVVIKADGTRVTLEATTFKDGRTILGWSPSTGAQGVDPYTGCAGNIQVGQASWWDASKLVKDPVTGSVFSQREWNSIQAYCVPNYAGKAEGELGGPHNWFEWDTIIGCWIWVGP